jgi:hypothetical protein
VTTDRSSGYDRAARLEVERIIGLGGLVFAGTDEFGRRDESQTRADELRDRKLVNAEERVQRALETLEAPMLAPWNSEQWIRDENEVRAELIKECRDMLARIAKALAQAPLKG